MLVSHLFGDTLRDLQEILQGRFRDVFPPLTTEPRDTAGQEAWFKASLIYAGVQPRLPPHLVAPVAPVYSYLCRPDEAVKNHPIELLGNYFGFIHTSCTPMPHYRPDIQKPATEYLFETHDINSVAADVILHFIFLIGLLLNWAFDQFPAIVDALKDLYREWIYREILRNMTWFDALDSLVLKDTPRYVPHMIYKNKIPHLQSQVNFLFLKASLKLIEPSQAILVVYKFFRDNSLKDLRLGEFVKKSCRSSRILYLRILEDAYFSLDLRATVVDLIRYIERSSMPANSLQLGESFPLFKDQYASCKALLKLFHDISGPVEKFDNHTKKENKLSEGILSQIVVHHLALQSGRLCLQVNDDARALFFCSLMKLNNTLSSISSDVVKKYHVEPYHYYENFIKRFLRCLNEDSLHNKNARGLPTISELFSEMNPGNKLIAIYRAWSFCLLILDVEWSQAKWQFATHLVPQEWQTVLLNYLQTGRLHRPDTLSRHTVWAPAYSRYIVNCCGVFMAYKQQSELRVEAAVERTEIQFEQYDIVETFASGKLVSRAAGRRRSVSLDALCSRQDSPISPAGSAANSFSPVSRAQSDLNPTRISDEDL
jgi:hypothetical protein